MSARKLDSRRLPGLATRVGRSAATAALAVVGAAALLIGAAILIARTPWGGDLIRRVAVVEVNRRIAGTLRIDGLRIAGNRIRLDGVTLHDPDGQRVLSVAHVDGTISPWALLHGDIVMPALTLDGPHLVLTDSGQGLDLTRALLARRRAALRTPDENANATRIEIRRLSIADATVEYRPPAAGALPNVRARALAGAGAIFLGLPGERARAWLRLDGELGAPWRGPLDVSFEASRAGNDAEARLALDAGAAALEARARRRGQTTQIEIGKLHVTPAAAAALSPGLKLGGPIDLTAVASGEGGRWRGQLGASAGGGRVHGEGEVDLPARRLRSLQVSARNLDLRRVLEELPRSDLAFDLRARGGGRTLATLDGELELTAPAGTLGGRRFASAHLAALAEAGRFQVTQLRAALPGFAIAGGGSARAARLDLDLDVRARDLAAVAESLGLPAHGGPSLRGRGRVHVHVGGTVAAPSVTARGRFASLAVYDLRLQRLAVAIRVPNLRRPTAGHIALTAGAARVRGRSLRDVSATVSSERRRFSVALRAQGEAPTSLSASGRWAADRRALTVHAFTLDTPEAHWRQQGGPIEISIEPGRLKLSGLALAAGAQSVGAEELVGRAQQTLETAASSPGTGGDIRPLADRAEQLHGQLSAGKKPKAKEIRALAEDIRKRVRSM